MQRRLIVDGDLLARYDIAQRNEENVFVKDLHKRVGPAGMIDVVSAVAAATSIETPAVIDCTDTQLSPVGPPICFRVGDFFPSVLGYFSTTPKVGNRKTALAFNWRASDCKTWSEAESHSGGDCTAKQFGRRIQ